MLLCKLEKNGQLPSFGLAIPCHQLSVRMTCKPGSSAYFQRWLRNCSMNKLYILLILLKHALNVTLAFDP